MFKMLGSSYLEDIVCDCDGEKRASTGRGVVSQDCCMSAQMRTSSQQQVETMRNLSCCTMSHLYNELQISSIVNCC